MSERVTYSCVKYLHFQIESQLTRFIGCDVIAANDDEADQRKKCVKSLHCRSRRYIMNDFQTTSEHANWINYLFWFYMLSNALSASE